MSSQNDYTLEAIEPRHVPESYARTHGSHRPSQADVQALTLHRFEFTGSGAEYFRIWVVNLLLTMLTFGVYSAWAKVRRLQYIYRNTRLDGAVFDYHGNPKAILKGRALALVLLLAYKIAADFSPVSTVVIGAIMAALLPWLLARSFRFKMVNSSYRGVRFRFAGTVGQAYRTLSIVPIMLGIVLFFGWSLLVSFNKNGGIGMALLFLALTLVLLAGVPLAHYLLKSYQHGNAYFGQSPFFLHAKKRDFFKIYGAALVLLIIGSVVAGFLQRYAFGRLEGLHGIPFAGLLHTLFGVLGAYTAYLLMQPYLEARVQNVVWNSSELGTNRFNSNASARQLLWLHASNLALIVATLGLFKPFAAMRVMKYRVESLALIPDGSLDDFLSDLDNHNASAFGQEAGDLFDLDIAL